MPLFLNTEEFDLSADVNSTFEDSKLLPKFQELSHSWISKPVVTLDKNVLYVAQREYAVIDPDSLGDVSHIATDSATTCHILILIHPDTKVVGLCHLDGCSTESGVNDLLDLMRSRVSRYTTDGAITAYSFDVYLFGGFNDENGTSSALSKEVLAALHLSAHRLDMKAMCIGDMNSRYENDLCYPIYYGAGVSLSTLQVFNIICKNHGPLSNVKGCRNFVGPKEVMRCYDNESRHMLIKPFDYTPMKQIDIWLQQSDQFLLKVVQKMDYIMFVQYFKYMNFKVFNKHEYLSTSPEQEPADFVSGVKESLTCMQTHPYPLETLFPGNQTLRFALTDGYWTAVT